MNWSSLNDDTLTVSEKFNINMPVSMSNVYSINTGLVVSFTNSSAGKLEVAMISLSNISLVN